MEGQINPAGDFLFKSVQEVSDGQGTHLKAPRSEADWKTVEDQLAVLRRAPDVLTARGLKAAPPGFRTEHPGIESDPAWIQKAIDSNRPDFDRRAMRLKGAADVAMQAAQTRDPRALERALDGVDKACEACHLHYFYPNDKRAWQAAKEDGLKD
jgi:cytochrome c556